MKQLCAQQDTMKFQITNTFITARKVRLKYDAKNDNYHENCMRLYESNVATKHESDAFD